MDDGTKPLILLSRSPRRRELMRLFGLPLRIAEAAVDETPHPGESPAELVIRLARLKAQAPIEAPAQLWRLAADTTVEKEGHSLGKPRDVEEARRMLRDLRGHPHRVHTGVALYRPADGRLLLRRLTSRLWMRDYGDDELERYIAAGEPFDKAGGYAIQDRRFAPVARLDGCYANVVGLPLCAVAAMLREAGLLPSMPDLPAFCLRRFHWRCVRVEEGEVLR